MQGWMFVHADGSHIRADWLTRRFAELIAELDMPPIRLHDLRHESASVMRAAGLDITYTQGNHGHSSPFTTLRYTHQLPEVIHSQAEQHWNSLHAATSRHFDLGPAATQS
jgi:integrase